MVKRKKSGDGAAEVVIAASGMISGILVLGVNAWMQQPVGFALEEGRVAVSDPVAIFRQPLWFWMGWHSTLACYTAVAFAVAGWYAWRAIEGRCDAYVVSAIKTAMVVGAVVAILQPLSGDRLAKFVFRTQPVKFAAMEGQFHTQRRAPLRIGGWPDPETQTTRFALEIPAGLSILAGGDAETEVAGLDRVPRDDWPNVEIVHLAFQVMVGAGTVLMVVAILFWGVWLRRRDAFVERPRLLTILKFSGPLGFLGLEAWWFVTEVGRQPWIIQQVMRTRDAVTPAAGVVEIFIAFTMLYILLTATVLVLLRRIAVAPAETSP